MGNFQELPLFTVSVFVVEEMFFLGYIVEEMLLLPSTSTNEIEILSLNKMILATQDIW